VVRSDGWRWFSGMEGGVEKVERPIDCPGASRGAALKPLIAADCMGEGLSNKCGMSPSCHRPLTKLLHGTAQCMWVTSCPSPTYLGDS
jgi:hypothetical protein